MVSAGVFIRRSMKGAVSIPINVSAIPPAAAMAYALWRPAFAVFSFPAPVNCAMVTAAPEYPANAKFSPDCPHIVSRLLPSTDTLFGSNILAAWEYGHHHIPLLPSFFPHSSFSSYHPAGPFLHRTSVCDDLTQIPCGICCSLSPVLRLPHLLQLPFDLFEGRLPSRPLLGPSKGILLSAQSDMLSGPSAA